MYYISSESPEFYRRYYEKQLGQIFFWTHQFMNTDGI